MDSRTEPVKLIDLACEEYEVFEKHYNSFLQSIRMISCEQENVWEPQDEKWNIAALGTDFSGHLLLIYSITLFSVHDLTNHLLALPISIKNAMYLEGGFPAGLYLSAEYTGRIFGDLDKPYSFNNDDGQDSRAIPNIIGIKRRPSR
jgi:hypothetical protein